MTEEQGRKDSESNKPTELEIDKTSSNNEIQ